MIKMSFNNKVWSEIKEKTGSFTILVGENEYQPADISYDVKKCTVHLSAGALELQFVGESLLTKLAEYCERTLVSEYEEPSNEQLPRGAWVSGMPWPKSSPDIKLYIEDFGDVGMLVQHYGVGDAQKQYPVPYITFIPLSGIGNLGQQLKNAATTIRVGFLPSGVNQLIKLGSVSRYAIASYKASFSE